MNRKDFTRAVTDMLRKKGMKKPISIPKQVFHISDDDGNSKDFTIKRTDKKAIYTFSDVDAVIEACLAVIKECLKKGDQITFRGFGTLGLIYRKERSTKMVGKGTPIKIAGHYIPKFSFGDDLRLSAKLYELSLKDRLKDFPRFKEDNEDDI